MAASGTAGGGGEWQAGSSRLPWLDRTRGLAILWVFVVHFVERFLCCASFANPNAAWPPPAQRFQELAPLAIPGPRGLFANALRYVAWPGDQAVQVFIIASAFILTRAALRSSPATPVNFWRKRLVAILPQWWVAHLALIVVWPVAPFLHPFAIETWLSFFGLRMLPEVMYYGVPAWWFIGLLLQIYLAFPFLLRLLNRIGPYRFAVMVGGGSILLRLAGLLVFDELLDWWSRGAILIARLPEVALGMSAAALLAQRPALAGSWRRPSAVALGVMAIALGNLASFSLIGCAVAFVLTGGGWMILGYALLERVPAILGRPVEWLGQRSLPFFLTHHVVILRLVPGNLSPASTGKILLYMVVSLAVSIASAVALDLVAARLVAAFRPDARRVPA